MSTGNDGSGGVRTVSRWMTNKGGAEERDGGSGHSVCSNTTTEKAPNSLASTAYSTQNIALFL